MRSLIKVNIYGGLSFNIHKNDEDIQNNSEQIILELREAAFQHLLKKYSISPRDLQYSWRISNIVQCSPYLYEFYFSCEKYFSDIEKVKKISKMREWSWRVNSFAH